MIVRPEIFLIALMLVVPVSASPDSEKQKKELADLRRAIGVLQQSLEKNRDKRDAAQTTLRDAELDVARTRVLLRSTNQELSDSRRKQLSLAGQRREKQAELAGHRQELGRQLRSAYISGRQERIRLLLNQENPSALGRVMTYYRYITEQRAELLAFVEKGLAQLRQLDRRAAEETVRLERLEQKREMELRQLNKAREQRAVIVARLDEQINSSGREIEMMQMQERELQRLLSGLRSALVEFPVMVREPFSGRKGNLGWPLAGQLLNDFGQPRAGGRLRWQGVMLGADRGTEVRAVYHGRVAYADWLPGMGLLMVIEHGGGFLSLYGHNESLYREIGDWVEAGETIGIVGDSGGNSLPALYFEIRLGVRPLNPHQWLARR